MSSMVTMFAAVLLPFLLLQTESAEPKVVNSPGFAVPFSTRIENDDLPTGVVIDKVVCRSDAAQSYALYLPSGYTRSRKWPILYALDPGARGKIPVARFQEAAEKYGWIVIGSNNSRNGAPQPSIDAWNAITRDTNERFTIDERRAYAAGFSGAARTAVLFASQCNNCLAGVIVFGAGFPASLSPSPDMKFSIFAAAGYDDFNFPEVKRLTEPLRKSGIVHRIETFDGRHDWPPATISGQAIEWMEAQSLKSGRSQRDKKLIESLWEKGLRQARALEDSNKRYEALGTYQSLVETFTDLRDVAEAGKKINELANTREISDAIRDEQEQFKKQRDLEMQIWSLIGERAPATAGDNFGSSDLESQTTRSTEPGLDAVVRVQGILTDLRKQSQGTDNNGKRRIARRVFDGVTVGLLERGISFLEGRKLYAEAIRTFRLLTRINSDHAGGFYYLAWAHAAAGDRRKALENLRLAVEKGFSDLVSLNENKAFDSLRNDPAYAEIVKTIKSSVTP